jgi:hypothetical protein
MGVTTIRSTEDLGALHRTWRELRPRDANADPEVVASLLEERVDALRPHVIVVEESEQRTMLVGRIERTRLPVRLGYLRLYAPSVRALNVVQGGLLGSTDELSLAAALDAATAALRDGEADVLRLRSLPVGGALHRLASERGSWATRGRTRPPSPRWRLFLPATLDEILALQSSGTRGNHRRAVRKLDDTYGDRLRFDVYRRSEDMARVLRDCAAVSATTYQRALGAGFAADPGERRLLELGAEQGWLRAYILSIDGAPRAFWVGQAYAGTFYTGPTGYDPALASSRPGTYVLMRMLEDLCADPEVDEVDWGTGDSEYKRHFATHGWLEEDVLLFAPTFRGARVNLTRSALLGGTGAARQVAERVPALRDVKRKWRARLAAGLHRPEREPLPRLARAAIVLALLPAVLVGSVVASAALDRPATTVHEEMVVHAPRAVVWRLLTEFDDYDAWNPYITEAHGDAARGEEIDLRLEPHGETEREMECDVVTVKHLRKLYWRCRDHAMPGLLDREHVFRLLPVAPGREEFRLVYDGRWEGVLVPFTELRNRKAGYLRMLLALKQRAELAG